MGVAGRLASAHAQYSKLKVQTSKIQSQISSKTNRINRIIIVMAVDPVGGFDSFSMNSMLSTSTVSIMEPPSRLESEYYPLREIYASHSEPLPLKRPGIKDSNSEGVRDL